MRQKQKESWFLSENIDENNMRDCPSCGLTSLQGMPGGKDSICVNCGYKRPLLL